MTVNPSRMPLVTLAASLAPIKVPTPKLRCTSLLSIMARSGLFLAVFSLAVLSVRGGVDFQCLLTNCPKEMVMCATPQCVKGMICMGACDGDVDCIYKCWADYVDDNLLNFVDCALGAHQCVVTPDHHPTVCRKPQIDTLANTFTMNNLKGRYYITYGLNPSYDCFDYMHALFEVKNNNTATMNIEYDLKMSDGTPKTFKQKDLFTNAKTESPAQINVTTISKGMRRVDDYRVLSFSDSYVFLYYCGKSCGIGYEGAAVYSRKPFMSAKDVLEVKMEAEKRGWDFSKFCKPKQKPVM